MAFAAMSLHWPLVGDAALMHYVVFLADHGMVPYRDIVDVNLPGTYLVESLILHCFGSGDLAWRLYDLSLCGVLLAAMTVVAWPVDQLAGVYAGLLFVLMHGRDGIAELGQRDLLMAAMWMVCTGLLASAFRSRNITLLCAASAVAGFAATVKPTAVLFWLAMTVVLLARARVWSRARIALAASLPFCCAPLLVALRLHAQGALSAFLQTMTGIDAYHNSLFRLPLGYFVAHAVPSSLLALTLLGVGLEVVRFCREGGEAVSLEGAALLAGVVCGWVSLVVQGKGYSYHRYPMDAFLLLLLSRAFFQALQGARLPRSLGALGLLFSAFVLCPQCLVHASRLSASPRDFSHLLQADLRRLGAPRLNRQVQCVDYTAGCIETLDRMQIVQSTGYLYDCYAFGADSNPTVQQYRRSFLHAVQATSPTYLVVSDQVCGYPDGFASLQRWPQLVALLQSRYVLQREVTPPDLIRWASRPAMPYSYRIYARR